MNQHHPQDIGEENLKRLLAAGVPKANPEFEERLRAAVLAQVGRQMRAARRRLMLWPVAVAAALLLAASVILHFSRVAGGIGQVRKTYGIVTVANGGAPKEIDGVLSLAPGQKIRTAWGSRAEITLADMTVLSTGPQTLVSVTNTPGGLRLMLEEGAVSIRAAKQPQGKCLYVDTPGAEIRVLGTVLDVLVTDGAGPKTTRVSVTSGRVELTSEGTTVVLAPNMEGLVARGKPPVIRAQTPQVNEIARLVELSSRLSAKAGVAYALPAIVEFSGGGAATVWSAVEVGNGTLAPLATLSFRTPYRFSSAKAFTLDGVPLEARTTDGLLHMDVSNAPLEAGQRSAIVIMLSGVEGLFASGTKAAFSFARGAGDATKRMLLEFCLPKEAWVGQISPAPLEERVESERLVLVLDANVQPLGLIEPAGD